MMTPGITCEVMAMPYYLFHCRRCGKADELWYPVGKCESEVPCGCGGRMRRKFTPPAGIHNEMAGFREGYNVSLDRYISSKRQLRSEMRRLEEELSLKDGFDHRLEVR